MDDRGEWERTERLLKRALLALADEILAHLRRVHDASRGLDPASDYAGRLARALDLACRLVADLHQLADDAPAGEGV